jgi:hypothetical protein
MAAGVVCNCTAISGNDGIKTSIAKPESGIKLSATYVFTRILDSVMFLMG